MEKQTFSTYRFDFEQLLQLNIEQGLTNVNFRSYKIVNRCSLFLNKMRISFALKTYALSVHSGLVQGLREVSTQMLKDPELVSGQHDE